MIDPVVTLLISVPAAAAVALGAYRARFLSGSGAVATFVLGAVVFTSGGLSWSIPLVAFFLPASIVSKLNPKKRRQRSIESAFEKGSTRDAGQVLANGGIAGLLALTHILYPAEPWLIIPYTCALAAASADTWGTEVGMLSPGRVVSVISVKPVPAGTSGGISLAGTLGAVTGAFLVALPTLVWLPPGIKPLYALPVILLSGTAGMLADSVAGATVQAQYRCTQCSALTERQTHCDTATELVRGLRRVNNDVVNLICCAAGAAVGYGLWCVW